ncbi:CUZD1 [Branchiostoma lanceolatum]|uniref:CUZD1 protein n=1 Tax=Branchiostoma lanceolatum TaxID=7740 RepID=A0A8K0EBW5_BRALA|nr:CUZD1 [Branchiostoma lanceolatum]
MLVLLVAVLGVLPFVSGQTTAANPDWRPCGDFPWDNDDVTVDCDYTHTDVSQWNVCSSYSSSTEPPLILQGRCTVTCPTEADILVGPHYSDCPAYRIGDGAYYCNAGNGTWIGTQPVCLDHYNPSTVITDDTNTIRLVGGESYGCVELYDDVTRQWGPVRGWAVNSIWAAHYETRMSWADFACKNLGFKGGLATAAYVLSNGVVSMSYAETLQSYYMGYYRSDAPKFFVSASLPQGEGATLHDAIDRVVRGPCPSGDSECSVINCGSWDGDCAMCLACAGNRTQDGPQDVAAHVTCTSDHLEASFPRPDDNSVQPADVQLAAPPCRAEGNSTHIYIRAPLGGCGTSSETTPSEMIYRNTLVIGADPSHGGITWQQLLKVPLECRLPRNKTLSLDFRPHLKSVFRSGVQGRGDFEISMELFRTDGFRYPVTEYPVFVELQQMIHVQIQVNSSDADLQVFPHTCVATPSDDPDDRTRNDVIIEGCAKLPTLQFYPSPGPDRGRFGFQAFAYTSGAPTVYLHCDVLLCKASDPNSRCAQGCQSPSGRRRREAEGGPEVYRLIQGPIVLGEGQTDFQARVLTPTSSRHDLVTASSILGACAVLAAAMFVVGLLYKARREGGQAGYRVLENVE